MFTYLKAKNFKSLKSITFNLNKTKTQTNNFIAIYGENGSGKTNIIELFRFLQESVMSKYKEVSISKLPKQFLQLQDEVQDKIPGAKSLLQLTINFEEYRMIDEKEDTEIKYGFKINGKDGYYFIKFNEEIIEEKLYYMIDKQRGFLYEITKKEGEIQKKLNNNIFFNNKYNEELNEIIEKYWGKHSFLSLLCFELIEKNARYIESSISSNLFDVIDNIMSIVDIRRDTDGINMFPDKFALKNKSRNIQFGTVKRSEINEIKKYEDILNIFFTQAYADIKSIKYAIEEIGEDKVHYELFFNKMIGGKVKSISSSLESNGTKRILGQFSTLIGALVGKIVIIDEIDNGIHDLLMKNIIMSIKDEITGQLIITTHNTLLLESLPKEYIYILTTDYNGNKTINSIKDYDIKIQKNNNARDLYFKGIFGGIPLTDYVDFEEIKYALEDANDEKEKTHDEKN